MSTTECLCQTQNDPSLFALRDGRTYELRRGCLVDCETRRTLTKSDETTKRLLEECELTESERIHWETFGEGICAAAAMAPMSVVQHQRNSCG